MNEATHDPDEDDLSADAAGPIRVTVGDGDAGQRLDRFLAGAIGDLSRNRLQGLIGEGAVRLETGGTVSDASTRVKQGDIYLVDVPPPRDATPRAEDIPLSIAYEDDHLIVVDKPAGLVVHPGAGNPTGTLVNALLHHCGDSLAGIGGVARPGIVHRIDKDTSGLLVAAKTERAHVGLADQFAAHSIERSYWAFVVGLPEPMKGTVDRNIARHPTDRIRFACTHDGAGKSAVTHYRVLAQSDLAASLVECRLETGRTHQIRVHMAGVGHALIGDPLYFAMSPKQRSALGKARAAAVQSFPRQALHARTLGFEHPVSGKPVTLESALPDDLAALAGALQIRLPG